MILAANLRRFFTVRVTFLRLLAVPFLAFFLSACSKEGGAVNPKIREKAPDLKQIPSPDKPNKEKGGAVPRPE